MAIVKDLFGKLDCGAPVYRYTMSNENGMRVSILSFGGAIQSLTSNKTALELLNIENFTDMIADETITTDCEELYSWLTEKGHPVLNLEPLM